MKRVRRSQKSVAATQVHVSVISSRFDLSEEPREREITKMPSNDVPLLAQAGHLPVIF